MPANVSTIAPETFAELLDAAKRVGAYDGTITKPLNLREAILRAIIVRNAFDLAREHGDGTRPPIHDIDPHDLTATEVNELLRVYRRERKRAEREDPPSTYQPGDIAAAA